MDNSTRSMVKKIDHIGIVVKDLSSALAVYTQVLGLEVWTRELDEVKLLIGFVPVGDVLIELIQPLDGEAEFTNFLARHGEGFHHLAYEVQDIHQALRNLEEKGVHLIDRTPHQGAEGLIAFVAPESMNGIRVELCEKGT
jgi:methylmalonyl-CoA/ethylmalonyl-CoA epimerase